MSSKQEVIVMCIARVINTVIIAALLWLPIAYFVGAGGSLQEALFGHFNMAQYIFITTLLSLLAALFLTKGKKHVF